jgi:PST family polysaccharide transporter
MYSGVCYTALSKYSGIAISLVVVAVLSRLLSPDDFGVVAIATVFIAFFSMVSGMGLSAAIVQHKELTKEQLSDIFSFTVWVGIAVGALFFAAAPFIGAYYENDTLCTLCRLLSVNLFFSAITLVPESLFYRHKQFRAVSIRNFIAQLIGGAAAIAAVLHGAGIYALVVNPLLSSALLFAISYARYPQRLRLTSGWAALRGIFSYSVYQLLFNVINYFSRNLDKLLIGKYMGTWSLGYYEKSYRLMMLPLQNVTQVLTPVLHPVLSDLQQRKGQLATSHERVARLLAFVGFPLSVWLFFSAQELTLLIFGQQWMPSVPVFRILALSVGLQMVLSSSGSIFQAAGDTRTLFVSGLCSTLLTVAAILLGIFHFGTLTGTAGCLVASFAVNFVQSYWLLYRFTLRQSILPFVYRLLSPVLLSLVLAYCLFPLQGVLAERGIIVSLAVKSVVGLLVCAVYLQLAHEVDFVAMVRRHRRKKGSPQEVPTAKDEAEEPTERQRRALFLVFHSLNQTTGISKKVRYQVKALEACGWATELCRPETLPDGNHAWMVDDEVLVGQGRGLGAKFRKRVDFRAIVAYVGREGIGLVYIRSYHNANPFVIQLVSRLRRAGAKVVMEIPTYPYDNEYSVNPFRSGIAIDRLFRRRLARQLDGLVTFSAAESIFGQRTIRISNGIDFDSLPLKRRQNDTSKELHLIGVAEIHFWHGYDRLVRGLVEYYDKMPEYKVYFHIVGDFWSERERKAILPLVRDHCLDPYVVMHGTAYGEELDELFEQCDFAIGSLARHRSDIRRIKTLKNREYAARGMAFAYSEDDEDFDHQPYVWKVPADESPIDIAGLVEFQRNVGMTPAEIRETVRPLAWDIQMQRVLNEIEKPT